MLISINKKTRYTNFVQRVFYFYNRTQRALAVGMSVKYFQFANQ